MARNQQSPYYSLNCESRDLSKRVYHVNPKCKSGKLIPLEKRLSGTNTYRRCLVC